MPISFEIPERIAQETQMLHAVGESVMRPLSREMDENEHERPWPFINMMWPIMRDTQARQLEKLKGDATKPKREGPGITNLRMICTVEELSWGDVGIYLCMPAAALGGYAIEATGTPEQKIKFLQRFAEGDTPTWGAMAMTEPGAGSDTSAIQTTARLDPDTKEWILNGEKIFCTSGKLALEESNGLVVVWATLDRAAGRAGMRPFVVEAGTPGVKIGKVEKKHGIRASDTASIVLDNARIPFDHILGDPQVQKRAEGSTGSTGFRGAMATFDASRPRVAASALGVGRAAVESVKEQWQKEGIDIPYGKPKSQTTAIQRDVIWTEAQ